MKKVILAACIVFTAITSFAQTKRIEHRSHSGSNKTFSTKGNSNFGLTPEVKRKRDSAAKAIDTVVQKVDSTKPKTKKKIVKKKQ